MAHYCDDCTRDIDHDPTDFCCGGDGICEAWADEPPCPKDEDEEHAWSDDVKLVGGCNTNPGVWSLGGTTYRFEWVCTRCGMRRVEVHMGWQRNPGECDTREYRGRPRRA